MSKKVHIYIKPLILKRNKKINISKDTKGGNDFVTNNNSIKSLRKRK